MYQYQHSHASLRELGFTSGLHIKQSSHPVVISSGSNAIECLKTICSRKKSPIFVHNKTMAGIKIKTLFLAVTCWYLVEGGSL